jgi:hypothetical protein
MNETLRGVVREPTSGIEEEWVMISEKLRWCIVTVWAVVALTVIVAVGAGAWWRYKIHSPIGPVDIGEPRSDTQGLAAGLELYRPGIANPVFVAPTDSRLSSGLPVIGIVVEGRSFAYSIPALSMPTELESVTSVYDLARRHVVNQLIDDKAVTITYCDQSHCARVLAKDDQERPLEVGIGGVFGNELILCWKGKPYIQSSAEIPLHDHPFQRTTWGEWFSQHPDTQLYLGDT